MSDIYKILFLDIETVPQTDDISLLPEEIQQMWGEKFNSLRSRNPERYAGMESLNESFMKNAGIYAEFGRIICISVGFIHRAGSANKLRIKSFAGDNETKLLKEFKELLNSFFTTAEHNFCGHNIKEFDVPYICRRMLINGIALPKALQIHTKKPWELNFLDTMDYWKFGDYKNYTSLKLLAAILGVPTPKDDIDGSQVASVYYEEKNLERIVTYCQKDVVATTQIWLRLNGRTLIDPENIEFTT